MATPRKRQAPTPTGSAPRYRERRGGDAVHPRRWDVAHHLILSRVSRRGHGVVEREPAAIDIDDLARHVARRAAEQEGRHVGDLVWLAQAFHRRAAHDAGLGFIAA